MRAPRAWPSSSAGTSPPASPPAAAAGRTIDAWRHPPTRVEWRDWQADALAEARERGRALLLAFHGGWGRPDLDAAAAADRELAALIGEATVPVAVDIDVAPEVAARFEADAGDVVVAAADASHIARPEPSELRGALAVGPSSARSYEEDQAPREQRTELSPSVVDTATEAALEVPVALGPEALRLLVYTSLRRERPDPLERAADDLLRRVSATSTVVRAGESGRLLLALAETALADAQLREELRAAAAVVADAVEALRDASGGFRAWARGDGATAPIVTADGNARMARGLLHAGVAFDELAWVEAGSRAADFLVRQLRAGTAGFYHAWDGSPSHLGWLGDQTAGALALLAASEVTGDGDYRDQATEVIHGVTDGWGTSDGRAVECWSLDDVGGPFDRPQLRLATNVELAEARLWLGRFTHDERYLQAGLDGLTMFAPDLEASTEAHVAYARVADRLQSARAGTHGRGQRAGGRAGPERRPAARFRSAHPCRGEVGAARDGGTGRPPPRTTRRALEPHRCGLRPFRRRAVSADRRCGTAVPGRRGQLPRVHRLDGGPQDAGRPRRQSTPSMPAGSRASRKRWSRHMASRSRSLISWAQRWSVTSPRKGWMPTCSQA